MIRRPVITPPVDKPSRKPTLASWVIVLTLWGLSGAGCTLPHRTCPTVRQATAEPNSPIDATTGLAGKDETETLQVLPSTPATARADSPGAPLVMPTITDAADTDASDAITDPAEVIPIPEVTIRTPPSLSHHRSAGDRPLAFWVFGRDGPTTLILGGMHGGENTPTRVCYQFIQYLESAPDAISSGRIVVAPLVDPDGFEAGTRGNAHGVDLNRNYPAQNWRSRGDRHGSRPESETETSFVLDLLAEYDPTCIISVHAALACVNYDGPAEDLARRMSRVCGLPVRASIGYPTPGSFGSYAGNDLEIPTITLELRSAMRIDPSFDQCRDAFLAAHRYSVDIAAKKNATH